MDTRRLGRSEIVSIRLNTVDIILLGYLLLLSCLETAFSADVSSWQSLVLANIFAASVYIVLLFCIQRKIASPLLQSTLHILSVSALTSFIYSEMGEIIHLVVPYWWDGIINSIERGVFSSYPTVCFQSIARPWLTEVMMFAYVGYVPLIPVVALVCLVGDSRRAAEEYITQLTLTYLACYLVYILLPVAGPSRALESFHTVALEGYIFTALSDYMIAHVHLPGGAFPSAHCAASVVMFVALFRYRRLVGYAFLPFALLVFASTVYGRFHYVTDVFGGIAFAVIAIRFTPWLTGVLGQRAIGISVSPRAAHLGTPSDSSGPVTAPTHRRSTSGPPDTGSSLI